MASSCWMACVWCGVEPASYVDCRGPKQLWLAGPAAGVGAVLAASLLWACAIGTTNQLELDTELVPEDDKAASTEGPDEAGLLGLPGPED